MYRNHGGGDGDSNARRGYWHGDRYLSQRRRSSTSRERQRISPRPSDRSRSHSRREGGKRRARSPSYSPELYGRGDSAVPRFQGFPRCVEVFDEDVICGVVIGVEVVKAVVIGSVIPSNPTLPILHLDSRMSHAETDSADAETDAAIARFRDNMAFQIRKLRDDTYATPVEAASTGGAASTAAWTGGASSTAAWTGGASSIYRAAWTGGASSTAPMHDVDDDDAKITLLQEVLNVDKGTAENLFITNDRDVDVAVERHLRATDDAVTAAAVARMRDNMALRIPPQLRDLCATPVEAAWTGGASSTAAWTGGASSTAAWTGGASSTAPMHDVDDDDAKIALLQDVLHVDEGTAENLLIAYHRDVDVAVERYLRMP